VAPAADRLWIQSIGTAGAGGIAVEGRRRPAGRVQGMRYETMSTPPAKAAFSSVGLMWRDCAVVQTPV
jgi:hypothetical protein